MLVWVFGGTAVGKKTFIRQMSSTHTYQPYWMEDGETDLDSLVECVESNDLLVRWQWDREEVLRTVHTDYPHLVQDLCLLYTEPSEQRLRLLQREDWDLPEETFIGEAFEIERLVEQLSIELKLSYVRIRV